MKKIFKFIPLLLTALVITACSSSSDEGATGDSTTCSPESLATVEAGVLTIATGEPAYYPWVIDDAPESGEGFVTIWVDEDELVGNTVPWRFTFKDKLFGVTIPTIICIDNH